MTAVNLRIAEPKVHIEIPMSLAPIPGDIDAKLYREEQITTAARTAMAGSLPVKGPLEVVLAMTYPPGASMRKGHVWRVTAPTCWDLARFILPLLQGKVFVSAGQIAKLTVEKTYGARPLTVITVRALV